jgi:4'-phosphopantetheinyl transferase EntD
VAELRGAAGPALLYPAEARYVAKAVLKRSEEFAAGRLCARRLLAEFGIHDFPIEVAGDRQPLWPEPLVGSITHTAGYCAAVVAEKQRLLAVGMDCEVAASVKAELWPSICVPAEIDWLRTLKESQRPSAATLIFSAKEAFYKCQYPLVRERLTFHDARVEVLTWGSAQGIFKIHASSSIAFADYCELPLPGQYLFHEEFVTTGVALPSELACAAMIF